jgi:hypothetical protein
MARAPIIISNGGIIDRLKQFMYSTTPPKSLDEVFDYLFEMDNTAASWIINQDKPGDPIIYWHLKKEEELNDRYRGRYADGRNHKMGAKISKKDKKPKSKKE